MQDDNINIIRNHYDSAVEKEWGRLSRHRIEFEITKRFLQKYINPGDRVLDIGGGPGRYSIWLSGMGCDVTLFDLSPENTRFAAAKAAEAGLTIKTVCGDARRVDNSFGDGEAFDHVLLMGPMYHLLEESCRTAAMESALRLLKPGGIIFVSFISLFAGLSYFMKNGPEIILEESEAEYLDCCLHGRDYAGDGFTKVIFINPDNIIPFMSRFPIEKLHLFGQEGIASPAEINIMASGEESIEKWIDISYELCEKPGFLTFPEHLMYVGRKTE